MVEIFAFLFVVKFSVLFGVLHGLRTNELNSVAVTFNRDLNRKWHYVQASIHLLIASFVAFLFADKFHSPLAFVGTLTLIWFLFDLFHNITTKQHPMYLESSGINGKLKFFHPVVLFFIKILLNVVFWTYAFKNPL